MWRSGDRHSKNRYTVDSSSGEVGCLRMWPLVWLACAVVCASCASTPRTESEPTPRSSSMPMAVSTPDCSPRDSSGWRSISYAQAAGAYALYAVSGTSWTDRLPPDSGLLVLTEPDSTDRAAYCRRNGCNPMPLAGTDIGMQVEGTTAWVPEAWRRNPRLQTLYVSLDSGTGSVELAMGGGLDATVGFRGGFTSVRTITGRWYSVVDERTVNHGLWCAVRLE